MQSIDIAEGSDFTVVRSRAMDTPPTGMPREYPKRIGWAIDSFPARLLIFSPRRRERG
jgi:hypothetical protein